eukprot:1385113-Heterocapsa_arctica.AAC.1
METVRNNTTTRGLPWTSKGRTHRAMKATRAQPMQVTSLPWSAPGKGAQRRPSIQRARVTAPIVL